MWYFADMRVFTDVIQLRALRWGGSPGLPNGAHIITCIPERSGDSFLAVENDVTKVWSEKCSTAGFEEGGRGHKPEKAGSL